MKNRGGQWFADRTREAFEAARAAVSRHNWRYINEPMPGLLSGRHRGALESRAEVCAFIDDDVRIERNWLNALQDAFKDPSVALVSGPSTPLFERIRPIGWPSSILKTSTAAAAVI